LSLFKRVGRGIRQIRFPVNLRRDNDPDGKPDGEVVDAILPGKTSKLQVRNDRTVNRHR
jgi:hypothetical protein